MNKLNMKVTKIVATAIQEIEKELKQRYTAVLKNLDKDPSLEYIVLKSNDEFEFNEGDVFTVSISKPDQKTLKEIAEKEAKESKEKK